MPLLEEVFTLSGVPSYTFVLPDRYQEMLVSVRTPGRCMVIEGPSGIGKTTVVTKILEELYGNSPPSILSARREADVEMIQMLPEIREFGVVIVDDFHRLSEADKRSLSDFMKVLADAEDEARKLILVGINRAGQQLIDVGVDLGLRIDIFKLQASSPQKILDLISKVEQALGVDISEKQSIADRSGGSFQIAQLLCHKLCAKSGIIETQNTRTECRVPLEEIIEDTMTDLGRQFKSAALAFCRGTKLRREGKAPYLHILRWLANSEEGSIDLNEVMRQHPDQRGSVGQVVNKGFLSLLINDDDKRALFDPVLFYSEDSGVLGSEDPKFIFYLRNLVWRSFTRECGYIGDFFDYKYEFALSFAGPDRKYAKGIADALAEREIDVFYDFNEQHNIIVINLEEYLSRIYRSEARYVVPILSPDYPKRVWTKFESDQFRERFGSNAVLPVRLSTVAEGLFSDESKVGMLNWNVEADFASELGRIVETLAQRVIEDRRAAAAVMDGDEQ